MQLHPNYDRKTRRTNAFHTQKRKVGYGVSLVHWWHLRVGNYQPLFSYWSRFDNPNLIPNPKIGPECCCGKIQTHPWFSWVRKGLKKSSFIFLHHPLEYHAEHTLYTLNTCNPKMVIWSFFIFNFIHAYLFSLLTFLFSCHMQNCKD